MRTNRDRFVQGSRLVSAAIDAAGSDKTTRQSAGLAAAIRIELRGHVQGVGFRPFVLRLAQSHGLDGYVRNSLGRVEILASGDRRELAAFCRGLTERAPPLARPEIVVHESAEVVVGRGFEIHASDAAASADVFVPPDSSLCDDCRAELADTGDRRHAYPFINCTQCGPRYTLIETMPYDRRNTSMAPFEMCANCEAEYRDPESRRFHAEPIACPACGPQLSFAAPGGKHCSAGAALDAAIETLQQGRILAVKGVGGYHLLCDAANGTAIRRLRRRKRRPDKPFAVMVPTEGHDGLDAARRLASLSEADAESLASAVRPVTLVRAQRQPALPDSVAPGLAEYGLLLPYSPLHELLLQRFGSAVVATSGNLSGEPVLADAAEAEARLAGVADAFLHHDRPIVRPADDAVVRTVAGKARPLRLGRGNAPRELDLPWPQPVPLVAVGGQMKATVTLSWGNRAVISPHIGDMDSPRSLAVFERVVADLQAMYGVRAERLACDAHPRYTTSRWAERQDLPLVRVGHHRAHASALVAEAGDTGPWLVFTWDGVGLGDDGTLWGGEAMFGRPGAWRRVASLRRFRLPGGERASREPWRSALGVFLAGGSTLPANLPETGMAVAAHDRGLNSPWTSAAGRLFDAAAAVIVGCDSTSYEAAAPMALEALCTEQAVAGSLPLAADDEGVLRSDWAPLLGLLSDRSRSPARRAEAFHASMAGIVRDQALALRHRYGPCRVGLCGGVFQNRVLAEQAMSLLAAEGVEVFLPATLPCNDAALSLGQAAEAAAAHARNTSC